MIRALKIGLTICLVTLLNGCYLASMGMHHKPGYANLEFPKNSVTDSSLKLSLGPSIVKPLRNILIKENPEHAELIKGVEAIRVRQFNSSVGKMHIETAIAKSIQNIKNDGWQTVVLINDDKDKIAIHMLVEGGAILGVSLIALDSSEAIFLNLIGQFNENHLSSWSESLSPTKANKLKNSFL